MLQSCRHHLVAHPPHLGGVRLESAYSSVVACRQELVEAAGDNITDLRATGGNQGYNAYDRYVDHLISAIVVRKHHVSVKLPYLRRWSW